MPVGRKEIRLCFERWFGTLPDVCAIQSPWCFLCVSALVDYLSAAAYPDEEQWSRYVKFIEGFFPAKYTKFAYKNGKTDLPAQMYYVLRNGLVHSFSLFPDEKGCKWGGRDRSIVLAHRCNAAGRRHLSQYSAASAPDAALFVAEDFLADTKKAAYKLLCRAKRGSILEQSVVTRFTDHPPIQWKS
jgi:hypothetical protein